MKKYIAFIVADVVLFYIMWYITHSLTTQEKEVTPEQKLQMMEIYFNAVDVANKFGPMIIEDTKGDTPITTTATAVLLVGFCIQAGISLHDTVDMVMSAYKQALVLQKDES